MIYKQLDSAIAFGAMAHAGQVRKYDGLPYITHPLRVMEILHATAAVITEDQLVAAVLHDVVEDTFVGIETIERRFGSGVSSLVFDLTDQFTHKAYPNLNRARRKELERERLSVIAPQAQDIKYADFIDNTRSIAARDPDFARLYLQEKEATLAVMRSGDPALLALAETVLAEAQQGLVQAALGDMV
jgi:(p)ppGpp synthase/HD superfamily hydrolase